MTTTPITRTQAVALTGLRLPYHHNWYLVTGLQWYPTYADYAHTSATANGLTAVIGKRAEARAA